MAETNTMDVIFVDYLLPGEPEDAEKHRVTLKEFLALPQEQLTEQNQKVQKALGQLYKLNDRKPPLFHSFPKREAGPLVVDCTPIEKANFAACYVTDENKIKIVKSELESTELWLLDTFAHELKHAEQISEEYYKMDGDAQKNDGLKYHQLRYLDEAQAYAFGSYVTYLFQLESSSPKTQWRYDKLVYPVLEKHTQGKSIDDFYDIQCEMMKEVLLLLYKNEAYRDKFDLISPILRKDKGFTEGDIPNSFHFKNPEEALSLLEDMPRDPLTWGGRKAQLQKEHKDVFESMQLGTPENLKNLVVDKLKSGEMPPKELLTMIKMEFATNPAENNAFSEKNKEMNSFFLDAEECIRNRNKDKLKFLLDLQVDGKPFMQKEFITKLLESARISGRKDVEEALLAYKTEHPNDKRFSERAEMFYADPVDKIAAFVKRQQRLNAEVKAAVENAAEKGATAIKKASDKGASTLTAAVKAAKSK